MQIDGWIELPEVLVEVAVAGSDDARYYLQEPYLDLDGKDGAWLVATNGHYLLAAQVKIDGKVFSGWISRQAIKHVRSRKQESRQLSFSGDMQGSPDIMFKRPDMGDAKYVEWRKVVPKVGAAADVSFQSAYLKEIGKALTPHSRYGGVRLFLPRKSGRIDPESAARLEGENPDDGVIAVLMPMR